MDNYNKEYLNYLNGLFQHEIYNLLDDHNRMTRTIKEDVSKAINISKTYAYSLKINQDLTNICKSYFDIMNINYDDEILLDEIILKVIDFFNLLHYEAPKIELKSTSKDLLKSRRYVKANIFGFCQILVRILRYRTNALLKSNSKFKRIIEVDNTNFRSLIIRDNGPVMPKSDFKEKFATGDWLFRRRSYINDIYVVKKIIKKHSIKMNISSSKNGMNEIKLDFYGSF